MHQRYSRNSSNLNWLLLHFPITFTTNNINQSHPHILFTSLDRCIISPQHLSSITVFRLRQLIRLSRKKIDEMFSFIINDFLISDVSVWSKLTFCSNVSLFTFILVLFRFSTWICIIIYYSNFLSYHTMQVMCYELTLTTLYP